MVEYLSVKDLAEKANMSVSFIRKHIRTKRLPGMCRFGRLIRFNAVEVEKRLLSGRLLLDTTK